MIVTGVKISFSNLFFESIFTTVLNKNKTAISQSKIVKTLSFIENEM